MTKEILAVIQPSDGARVREALLVQGWNIRVVGSLLEAREAVAALEPDVLVLDSELDGDGKAPCCSSAVVLGNSSEAPVTLGTVVLARPFTARELNLAVRQCLARRRWEHDAAVSEPCGSETLLVN